MQLLKRRKDQADTRLDSPLILHLMGPSVQALLFLMSALGILYVGTDPDAIVFPDIDPKSERRIVAPALTVQWSTELLRRYIMPSSRRTPHSPTR